MEEGDLEAADFPNAKKFHWRLFWKKMKAAKKDGVQLPAATLPVDIPSAPASAAASTATMSIATNRQALRV